MTNPSQFSERKLRNVPVADLKIAPWLKGMTHMKQGHPEYDAMMGAWMVSGVPPLAVTPDNLIADGRHRFWWAERMKLATLPCYEVSEEEGRLIAITSVTGRKHLTASQRAYLVYPHLKPAFAEAEKRRLAQLKNAGSALETKSVRFDAEKGLNLQIETLEDWAERLGCTVRLIQHARELHELFTDDKERTITDRDGVTEDGVTLKDFFEPRLLRSDEPYGLGGVLTAIKQIYDLERKAGAGKAHTGGKPKQVEKQLGLFDEVVKDGIKRFTYWRKFDAETRNQHWEHVRQQAAKLKQGECEELADYYARLAKEYAKAAKEAANAE
jgi:hypothetical protein